MAVGALGAAVTALALGIGAWRSRGLVDAGARLVSDEDYLPATRALTRAVVAAPRDARAHYYLGLAYAGLGQDEAALHHVRDAVRLAPREPAYEAGLATVLLDGGRVAEAVATLGLKHAVVTSVNRDDDNVGGAKIFAETIRGIRELVPDCRVEVLIPDFQGLEEPLRIVLEAKPNVLNHNTESVPRLYRVVRSGARYQRTLDLLSNAKNWDPQMVTKSGVMVGLGETTDELIEVFRDLGSRGVDILTVGQYLRPSKDHLPMARFYAPAEFVYLKEEALKFGFKHVESGPLVRSSYHAHEQADVAAR